MDLKIKNANMLLHMREMISGWTDGLLINA